MKKIAVATFILLVSYSSFAQIDTLKQEKQTPPSPVKWTLKQCIDYALANNLNVKNSVYNVESSEIDLRVARWGRIPTASANAYYGYGWGRNLDPVQNDFVSQEIRSSQLQAQGALPLFNGLRIHNGIKQYQSAYAASEYKLAKAKNDVILNVANLFINVVFNKELVENAKFQLASSQQQLERTRKQVLAGALAKSEELNLDAQTAGNEVTLVQKENDLALSILQLKQALLIPATDPLDVEVPNLSPEDLVLQQTRDEIFDIAKQTMPEVKSAALTVQSAEYGIRSAKGALYPRLSLTGSINTNYSSVTESLYSFGQQLDQNLYRTAGLQLSIPILNGFSARANMQRSRIQKGRAELDVIQISNDLRQVVERAYNDAVASSKTYNSSLRQVSAREEAFRIMTERFTAGSANSFEYQIAQINLYSAQTDLARAKYDFIFKKKVLDFYQGKTIEY